MAFLEDSLIPRDEKIGVYGYKARCLDYGSYYATPFYATPVLIHTWHLKCTIIHGLHNTLSVHPQVSSPSLVLSRPATFA